MCVGRLPYPQMSRRRVLGALTRRATPVLCFRLRFWGGVAERSSVGTSMDYFTCAIRVVNSAGVCGLGMEGDFH